MKAALVAPRLWRICGTGSRLGAQALQGLAGPWGAPVLHMHGGHTGSGHSDQSGQGLLGSSLDDTTQP